MCNDRLGNKGETIDAGNIWVEHKTEGSYQKFNIEQIHLGVPIRDE